MVNVRGGMAVCGQFVFMLTFDATHQELSFSPGKYVYDYSLSAGVKYIFGTAPHAQLDGAVSASTRGVPNIRRERQ